MAQRVVIPGFRKIETSGGEGGSTNYNDLSNKPSINNIPLVDNLTTEELKLTDTTLTKENVPAESKTVGQKLKEKASYEEGVFTPSIVSSSVQPSSTVAQYKKVGKIVYISIKFVFDSEIDPVTLNTIIGLPFTVDIDNATGGRYLLCATTNHGRYAGMAQYDNYMNSSPCVSAADVIDRTAAKVFTLYGQYESTV